MGTAHVGGTLTAKVATSAAKGTTYVFQWQTRKKVTVRKKTVTRWVAIARASKATLVPTAGLKGSSVRACVKAKGMKSAWKCSGAKVVAAALAPAAPTPATPTPATPTPARPNPLSVSYLTQRFITGSAGTVLSPTITGGFGTTQFSVSGTLPTGVAFDQATGTFTGPAASAWNFRATQIAAGDSHTCALTTSGGVKCWGYGPEGTLGNGATPVRQATPVDVVATGGTGTLSGITQIAAGSAHNCALTTQGGVKCWGFGATGQLGNGATSNQSTPVDVVATGQGPGGTALSGITQIAAGVGLTCALTTQGGVKCWGYGANGRLGNGATSNQSTPVDVVAAGQGQGGTALSGITQITTGRNHACALTTSGGVACWGTGDDGQLGNGSTPVVQPTPVHVVATGGTGTLSGITQIAAGGYHTCALTTPGGVTCWGMGRWGQLGNGATPISQSTPVGVLGAGGSGSLSGITGIAAGGIHTCAITTSRGLQCWGSGVAGRLGNGAESDQTTPVDVLGAGAAGPLSGVTQVGMGWGHACSVTMQGRVACWGGHGNDGRLGNGAFVNQLTAVDVVGAGPQGGFPAALTVTATDATGSTSASVYMNEAAKPWFSYPNRLFTMGQEAQQIAPAVTSTNATRQFSVSGPLPASVTFDQATGRFTGPAASAWNFKATQITSGGNHTCALTSSGGVKCWGYGGDGALGNGDTSDQSTPVDVFATGGSGTLSNVTQIAAGAVHTCALTTSGRVKCWGYGAYGQLGNGATFNQSTPVDVVATGQGPGGTALTGITQISTGTHHTCALTTSGGVKCWGWGERRQLGNDATSNQTTPVDVLATGQSFGGSPLSGITQVTAGYDATCALTTDGGVKCWGDGVPAPVDVLAAGGAAPLSGVARISAGLSYTCALTTSGGVKCWGRGDYGQLGDGATSYRSTPVDVCVTATTPGTCDGAPLGGVTEIAAGDYYACALTSIGGVKCWGDGTYGQLGNGTDSTPQSTPVAVVSTGQGPGGTALSGITQVASGGYHSCVVTTSGGVKCWGRGNYGRLGNGAAPDAQLTPVDVTRSGEQPGFPAVLSVTVTDDTGSWTLGRVVLGTK